MNIRHQKNALIEALVLSQIAAGPIQMATVDRLLAYVAAGMNEAEIIACRQEAEELLHLHRRLQTSIPPRITVLQGGVP